MKYLLLLSIGLFISSLHAQEDSLFVTVHVIYGSKPLTKNEHKWFGGKLGGHVGLEISPNKVLHFNPGGKVGAWENYSDTGSYKLSSVSRFYKTFGNDSVKRMNVKIPITKKNAAILDSISQHFTEHAPYPYAFFGMRCAAACYHLLSLAEVYPPLSKRKMIHHFFYPRKLRKQLIRSAKKSKWKINITEGRKSRKWDHD